ncbi:MAG TPA: hypothetical protein PKA88_03500 [Polyangiaceae bacterium]|nr:hypothetical protein [Polyangiaceae bacterium]
MTRTFSLLAALCLGAVTFSADAIATGNLKTHAPVNCHGDQRLVLDGVKIVGKVAVNAHGDCDVLIRNSHIEGSGTAVDAHGNANVRIENTLLRSSGVALDIHGNSDVHLKNTRVEGPMRRHGNGDLDDQGGNHYAGKKPPPTPQEPPAAKPSKPHPKRAPHAPIRCDRGQVQKLSGVRIATEGTAIDVQGGCTLVLSDSEIHAGQTGLRVRGGGTVTLLRSSITGKAAALDLAGGATVYVKSSEIQGKIKKSGGSVIVRD